MRLSMALKSVKFMQSIPDVFWGLWIKECLSSSALNFHQWYAILGLILIKFTYFRRTMQFAQKLGKVVHLPGVLDSNLWHLNSECLSIISTAGLSTSSNFTVPRGSQVEGARHDTTIGITLPIALYKPSRCSTYKAHFEISLKVGLSFCLLSVPWSAWDINAETLVYLRW